MKFYFVIIQKNNTFRCLLVCISISCFLFLSRIQTGKLSEFMTTSCCAHLSFLDGKGSGSMDRHDEESNDGDERDADGCYSQRNVHELRHDDGKEKRDGRMVGV